MDSPEGSLPFVRPKRLPAVADPRLAVGLPFSLVYVGSGRLVGPAGSLTHAQGAV